VRDEEAAMSQLTGAVAGGGPATAAVLWAPLVAPLAAAAVAAAGRWRRSVAWSAVAAAAVILGCGVVTAVRTVDGQALASGGLLRVDALSAFMLVVIGGVAVIATWAGVAYIDDELAAGHPDLRGARLYGVLVPLFLAAMVLAVLAANLGVLWAAVEATTVVTAFLVGHRRTRASLEATWKYVIICSVGIALAYLGTVLVYFASQHTEAGGHGSLEWAVLAERAGSLDPGVMRVAFALLVLGFGTKAGLVPLHSWLPDAHSQAPAPVSALMSGVLLSVAAYAMLRYHVIVAVTLDPEFVRTLLLVVGFASLAVATSLLIAQRDYKRLLAYSSIEHMALVTIGMAIGTRAAIAAILLHILGHGLAKAVLFCGSGQILILEGTTRIEDVKGLLARYPALAGVFALGLAALLGLPPFSLFASELALARAGGTAGLGWAVGALLLLLLVAFVAVGARTLTMLFGAEPSTLPAARPAAVRAGTSTGVLPLGVGLLALAVLGLATWPLEHLLRAAATIAGTS
jgi:hydrogenase-4 component F